MDDVLLRHFHPRAMLRVPKHTVNKPKFPVIDMHNHRKWLGTWQVTDVPRLVTSMNEAGVVARVDLDGGNADRLFRHLERFTMCWPGRFSVYAQLEWDRHLGYDNFGERMANDLKRSIQHGAERLKVWKEPGLTTRDNHGKRIPIDDRRLDQLLRRPGSMVFRFLSTLPIPWHFLSR